MFAINDKIAKSIETVPKTLISEKAAKGTLGLFDKTQMATSEALDKASVKNFSKAYTKPPEAGKKIDLKL